MYYTKRGLGLLMTCTIGLTLALGCREHYPHSFTWPATGDTIPTHPKPPEGGYYSNWDPYAATIELTPVKDVNPVRTQHVMIATVLDHDGKPLPNRRIEWILADGSVGDIVEVDESGWRASRGYKQTNDFAVSHTNNFEHVLDRGNDDPSDDIHLGVGQSWCVITSPIEGETNIIAYAPGIYNWENHKAFAVKQWYDVTWEIPPPATNPTGKPHELVTRVMKYSDGSPLEGYIVNYELTSGPAGRFTPGNGTSATARTDAQGMATVTLNQESPVAGTNDIAISIMRPANEACCEPAVHIADEMTQKVWIAPGIAIEKTAPATSTVGAEFQYGITVRSTSDVPAENVVVTDPLPNGIEYVSSQPSASASGNSLTWQLGDMAPGTSKQLSVTVRGTRTGSFENCAEVRAAQGLSDRACATTVITAPGLELVKECTPQVLLCDPITYTMTVRNPGDAAATGVVVTEDLPDGLETVDGKTSARYNFGTLEPGASKRAELQVRATRTGQFTNTARATADGGLTADASCTTVVTQPVLTLTKTGPGKRYVNRPVEYTITVGNTGDADATNTVVTDTIPAGAEFVSASDGGNFSNGRVTWNLGTLAPAASRNVTLTLRSSQRGEIRNTATATANCAEASAETGTAIEGIPAILLEVIDVEDPIEVGSNVTYVITVTNQGSADGTGIVIKATLPPEQEFVSAEGPTGHTADGKTITFNPLPQLDPRAVATYRVIVKGTQAGDVRFRLAMTSNETTSPVEETESTNQY